MLVNSNCKGFSSFKRWSIMLSFSETFFLKTTRPIALISLLVFSVQSKIVKPTGMTVWIVSTSQMFANFSWFWKRKFQTLLSLLVQKDVDQKRSAFSQYWGLHFVPPLTSSSFHHSSSVTYSMLNRCKKSYFIDHSSYIYHPFIYWISNLFIWAVYSALWVIYFSSSRWELMVRSRLFILCSPN